MYKELLPKDCPPKSAIEEEKILYRICVCKANTQENYLPYTVLYPNREDYKGMCEAYSISLFDNRAFAVHYAKRNTKLGSFIAEISVKNIDGKLKLTNKKTGHYALWLYKTFDCASLSCKIETLHAD